MRRFALIAFSLFAASSSVFSQDELYLQPVIVNETEVTWLDQLAAARDLVFDPSNISSYWPEYLYGYEQIRNSRVCTNNQLISNDVVGIDIDRALEIDLGDIAFVWASAPTEANSDKGAEYYSGYKISSHGLRVEQLCELVKEEGTIKDILNSVDGAVEHTRPQFDENQLRIVTSEVFPDTSAPFEHYVRLRTVNRFWLE